MLVKSLRYEKEGQVRFFTGLTTKYNTLTGNRDVMAVCLDREGVRLLAQPDHLFGAESGWVYQGARTFED